MDNGKEIVYLGPLRRCWVERRVNRFTVLVKTGKREEALAYTNNTGRLHDYIFRGAIVYCKEKKSGKTALRIVGAEDRNGAALIDTSLQMKSFEIALSKRLISWLVGCSIAKRNPRYNSSLLDYLLQCDDAHAWAELKSAAMRSSDGCAMYPDCPSLRGRRHIEELIRLRERGDDVYLVFVAAIPGAKCFKPYGKGDPMIPVLLSRAAERGVRVKAISMYLDTARWSIVMENPDLPVYIER